MLSQLRLSKCINMRSFNNLALLFTQSFGCGWEGLLGGLHIELRGTCKSVNDDLPIDQTFSRSSVVVVAFCCLYDAFNQVSKSLSGWYVEKTSFKFLISNIEICLFSLGNCERREYFLKNLITF